MTPNLTELIQRVEEAEKSADCCIVHRTLDELNAANHALIARLLSVIRCEECGGTGNEGYDFKFTLDGGEAVARPCPTCGPDRAAIERMKGGTDEAK